MRTVLFLDVNGTLFHDWLMVYTGVRAIFRHYGIVCPTLEQCIREVCHDGNWIGLYERRGIPVEQCCEELIAILVEAFHAHTPVPELMPGVHEALDYLKRAGVEMHVLTAASASLAQPLLERTFPSGYFAGIHYGKDNKALAVQSVLNGSQLVQGFLVGDMPSDMCHARRAGVRGIRFVNPDVPSDLFEEMKSHIVTVRSFLELTTLFK